MRTKGVVNVLIVALSFVLNLSVRAQDFKWIRGGGTNASSPYLDVDPEGSKYMCVDDNGNVYSLNNVGSTAIYADTFYRPGAYGVDINILITSHNCQGQLRWAKLLASNAGECKPYGITTDKLGHIYVAGTFVNTTLHIGSDTSISGLYNDFQGLMQFDTNGHFNWMRYVGDNTPSTALGGEAVGSTLTVDASNNVHFLNYMKNGVHITPTITSQFGQYDLTYNPSGTLQSAVRFNMDSVWYVLQAIIDSPSKIMYTYGVINTGATGGFLAQDFFTAAFDSNRNILWMYPFDTVTGIGPCALTGMAYDKMGHLYFSGSAELTPGLSHTVFRYRSDSVVSPYGGGTAIVLKTDTLGNPIWIQHFDGTITLNAFLALTLMPHGKLAAAGYFLGQVDAGGSSMISYAAENINSYFSILDTAGNIISMNQIHGNSSEDMFANVVCDKAGSIYLSGQVGDSTWAGSLPAYHSVGGNTDFVIMKYGVDCSCSTMPMANNSDTGTHTIGFTYTGTTAGVDSVRWNFDDGSAHSPLYNPIHTFTTAGIFHVSVTAYSGCGNDVHFTTIVIPCVAPPVSALTMSGTSATRTFVYSGTTTGLDSVVWRYSDGGHATGLTNSHTFSAIGTYTVCATAYNPCGNDSACLVITIPCTTATSSAFTSSGLGNIRNFSFTGSTSVLDSVVWHYGDGGHSTGLTATHTYAFIGTFTVCAIAYSPCGRDSVCVPVTIPCASVLSAAFTSTGAANVKNFSYTGSTTAMDSVVWHFGDGGHSTGITSAHTYTTVGSYTVCALAYNPCGVDSICNVITVPCVTAPLVSFTQTGSTTVQSFTYTGSTTIDSVVWHFGDGASGSGITITHTYPVVDTYHVCCIAYSACGNDSVCNDIIVLCPTPIASFSHSGTSSITFNFTGTTAGVDSIVWNYGDGQSATGTSATHGYAFSGTYHVCVTVYSICGIDSTCSDIHVTGVGFPATQLSDISIFPNPANNRIYIAGIFELTSYSIHSSVGQTIQNGILRPGENEIFMNDLPKGIYLLELKMNQGEQRNFKITVK